jgi:hypothetical integral membrane protein (TIGR02206 family)
VLPNLAARADNASRVIRADDGRVSAQYWTAVALCAGAGGGAIGYARRAGGARAVLVGRGIAVVLGADAIAFVVDRATGGAFTAASSLPLDLCDLVLLVAAVACWVAPRWPLGVELTWFWGMAGTLQAVVTPDLRAAFPHAEFFEFVVGHVGAVVAALYLVVGRGLRPRPHAVPRVLLITIGYAAVVGVVDAATGGNYMYLRRVPGHVSLLSELGPWPWYIASAAVVAVALFVALDLPFRRAMPSRDRMQAVTSR